MSPIHHRECRRWAGCRGTRTGVGGPEPEGEVLPGLETPRCPQTQLRGRWSSPAPSGMGSRAPLAQQRGCRRDAMPRRSQQKAGTAGPQELARTPGCRHRPLAMPCPVPGWAGAEEPQPRARQPRRGARHSGQPRSFPPGRRALPAPSTAASLPLRPGTASCQRKASAEDGNQPWGCPCATHLVPHTVRGTRRGRDGQEGLLSGSAAHTDLALCISCPCPSRCQAPISILLLLLLGAAAWVPLPQGSLAREAPRYFHPASPTIPARTAASAAPGELCPAPPRPAPARGGGTPRGCALGRQEWAAGP